MNDTPHSPSNQTGLVEGLDISYWQNPNDLDWPALVRRGVKFVICRATYGTRRDTRLEAHVQAVRRYDLQLGLYAFFRQTQPALDQLKAFADAARAVEAWRPGDHVPHIDLETNEPNGDGHPSAKLFAQADLMADALTAQYGAVCLYMSSFFPQHIGAPANLAYKGHQTTALHGSPAGWLFEPQRFLWAADWGRAPGKMRTPYGYDPFVGTDIGGPPGQLPCVIHQPRPATIPEYRAGSLAIDLDYATPKTLSMVTISGTPPVSVDVPADLGGGTEHAPPKADTEPPGDLASELRLRDERIRSLEQQLATAVQLHEDLESALVDMGIALESASLRGTKLENHLKGID